MIIHDFDINTLNEVIKEGDVVIDFYADWCGPCKMLGVELEEFTKSNNDVKIYKINVDNNPEIARNYGVMTIPTLVLYKNGELVNKHIGYFTCDDFKEWVKGA